ncbi:3-isopropylmalate dehydratase small subunit [Paractinoplanes deccanensis]|uniref:3-isopropylmalate dehydratase small subunit n=1 Tax=Paractinoplanes deccanensis TaxID=113561 RepID=A0ABQ3YK87_9ACTN|nr:3-isopropylmalate dehydratase small subunit [Actinoplanes deccanensis]GID80421.1 3-isopropylmalate dehydratase small subunit [Actinoplanes deccanensis]
MEPLTDHTGRVLPLRRSDVDTDQIIPSRFCRRLTKTGYADGLFARWREADDFVLNDPARAGGSVLVAGPNFATGSSREHAVWALRDWGIAAVLAPSFGDIFRRNALKNGLLAVQLPDAVVSGLLDAADRDPGFLVTVDLVACEVRWDGGRQAFEVDPRARRLLLDGQDDIAVTLADGDRIAAYERGRPHWLPVFGAARAG